MRTESPLRYPGGKGALGSILSWVMRHNRLRNRTIAEPYAGGAGAALGMLFRGETPEIHINDADPAIHAFWWAVTHDPEWFLMLLEQTPVTVDEWYRQRTRFKDSSAWHLHRGFAAFYLNRCNRSGIILNGSVIGGLRQTGRWKIDARFNKEGLRRRIERIAAYRDRIRVTGIDGREFIAQLDPQETFFLIDPPYYHKGKTLYLNGMDPSGHRDLAASLRHLDAPWVLTYDDCEEIREMYGSWACLRPYTLRYSASTRRQGSELLITPRWMAVPKDQQSKAIDW